MTLKAPFPYFGGKSKAAHIVWRELGDVGGYVEPFAGSAAVLLARPEFKGRRVETLNDADGWLVNAWRAIQLDPVEVARHAWGPVTEIDYHARLAWLQERRTPELASWLEGDPEHYDAKAAGWWLYVVACGIGDPWNKGPWRVVDGHLRDVRELPHLGNAGKGVNRELPHLGNAGKGEQALAAYLSTLTQRLESVRITCGSWERVTGRSVLRAKAGKPHIGVFLDPPYTTSGDLYAETNTNNTNATIAESVREWCKTADSDLRIVLCGYSNEHDDLLGQGWRVAAWKSGGTYGGKESDRERMWFSPACLGANEQLGLDWEVLA